MSRSPVAAGNIKNRSPYCIVVKKQRCLDRQFPFGDKKAADQYLAELLIQGHPAKLIQLDTSFQLRIRRAGIKTQTITFDSLDEAEKARLEIESKLSLSIVRDYAVATRFSFRELALRYINEVVPSHKGGDVEISRLNRILRDESFVDKKLALLSTEDLQDFITDRLTDVKPATVDRDLDLISQVLKYASDVWKIAPHESPFKGLRRPKYFNERDRRLRGDEELALLAAARQDENPYIEAAIILALETAMRRGEILSLSIGNIFFQERYAFLPDTKNGRSRKVPLSSRAIEVLQALINDLPDDDPDRLVLPMTANALKIGFFRRILPNCRIDDLHFHDLRHEAISRLAESGKFTLVDLQAISGHRDTRMLLRYAHLCATVLANKMDAIAFGSVKNYVHRGRRRVATHIDRTVQFSVAPRVATNAMQQTLPVGNVIPIFRAKVRLEISKGGKA